MKKRLLAGILTLVMLLGLFPTAAFAAGATYYHCVAVNGSIQFSGAGKYTSEDESIAAVSSSWGTVTVTGHKVGNTNIYDQYANKHVITVYDPNGDTPVYIYVKLNNPDHLNTEGWNINADGWYTMGVIMVPNTQLGHATQVSYADSTMTQNVIDYVKNHKGQITFKSTFVENAFDLDRIAWTETNGSQQYGLHGCPGATDYDDAPSVYAWHLDGLLTLQAATYTLKVDYVWPEGETPPQGFPEDVDEQGKKPGDKYEVSVPQYDGYNCVVTNKNGNAVTPENGKITGQIIQADLSYTVTYTKRTDLSYTVKYLDEDTNEPVNAQKTVNNQTFGTVVTAEDEKIDIDGYTYVRADKESLTISAGAAGNVITIYYAKDENRDNIPDKYQKKVTFKVVNGTWEDKTEADKVVYVTLLKDGKWDQSGSAGLTAPAGMAPKDGFTNGKWDTTPPETVSGTGDAVYTYTFDKESSVIVPVAAAYRVEHYCAGAGGYELKDTELLYGKLGDTVNAAAKNYGGYALDQQISTMSGTVTMPKTEEGQLTGLLTLKLYYDVDRVGTTDPDKGDGVPDKYQATIEYVSANENMGAVTGLKKEVKTIFGDSGAMAAAGTVTASGSEAAAKDSYIFKNWTHEGGTIETAQFGATEITVRGGAAYAFTANWDWASCTLTYNANGGSWTQAVSGYDMGANNTTASIGVKPYQSVDKIGESPVREGYVFTGWYDDEACQNQVPFINGKLNFASTRDIVLYAGWVKDDSDVKDYVIRQHLLNAGGKEDYAFNDTTRSAVSGAGIDALIADYAKDQTYYDQKYIYAPTQTTVNGQPLTDGAVLTISGTRIDLYYYLDAWDAGSDKETGGDEIPDVQQALIRYEAQDGNGTVEPAIQVETLALTADGGAYEKLVTVSSTATAAPGYAFDYWQAPGQSRSYDEKLTGTLLAQGGRTYVYTACFAVDKTGPENKPDGVPDKYQATLQYVSGGNGSVTGETTKVITLTDENGRYVTSKTVTPGTAGVTASANSGYKFSGWTPDPAAALAVTGGQTYIFTAKFTRSGGTVDPTPSDPSVTYWPNYGNKNARSEGAGSDGYVTIRDASDWGFDRDGYLFTGWNTQKDGRGKDYEPGDRIRLTGNLVLYAQWKRDTSSPDSTGVSGLLNTGDHIQYLYGYPDGTFGPTRNMTRAEAAQMFYNLLLNQNVRKTAAFSDVEGSEWFADAVHTMAALGVLKGYPDGTFQPNKPITRAEFTTMAMQFTRQDQTGGGSFSDVSMGDWFYTFVAGASKYGWISGYPDGTFKPNANITRAEVTSIVNSMLGRYADEDYVDDHPSRVNSFTDLKDSYWAYYPIMEATNEHDYSKGGQTENWSGVSWRAKR